MRAFSFLALVPLMASAVVNALVIPRDDVPGELRGYKPEDAPGFSKRLEPSTNAERLARGLPLRAPTRVSGARRAVQSPTIVRKVIKATYADDNTVAGYVAQTKNSNNVYAMTANKNSAVHVEITLPFGQTTGSQINIRATDGDFAASFPWLALVVGPSSTSNDLSSGSYNYVFLSGTNNQTPAGSPPQSGPTAFSSTLANESAVWTVNTASNTISAQWINTNGSPAPTYFIYAPGPNFITATGDVTTYRNAFGSSRRPITLSLEDY